MNIQAIEGITPAGLWNAMAVFLGICAIYLIVDKVIISIRNHVDRKRMNQKGPQERLAQDISQKVMDALEPRFVEIDRKLNKDNMRIEEHERRLSKIDDDLDKMRADSTMMLRGQNMMIMHEITGNSVDGLKRFKEEMDGFMAAR